MLFAKVVNIPDDMTLENLRAIFAKQVVLAEFETAPGIHGVISINGKPLPEPKMHLVTESQPRHTLKLQPKQAQETWAAIMAARYQEEIAQKKKSGLFSCFACKKKAKAGQ